MILLWVFVFVLAAAIIYLNFMCTQIIQSSQLHNAEKKRQLILIVWLLPIAGVFISLLRINKDIKKNREKIEGEIAPAIRELADKLRVLENDIQQEQQNEQKRSGKKDSLH